MKDLFFTVRRATYAGARLLAFIAGLAVVGLVLVNMADIILDLTPVGGIRGLDDYQKFLMVIVAFFGLAYCGAIRGHVVIDFFIKFFPANFARWLDVVLSFIGFIVIGAMAYYSGGEAVRIAELGQESNELFIPLAPFIWLLTFGAAYFALILLIQAIEGIVDYKSNQE